MTLEEIKLLIVDNMLTSSGRVKGQIPTKYSCYIIDIINITNFLDDDNITLPQRVWHIIKGELKLSRCIGGNLVKFNNYITGYQKHCNSKKCICNKAARDKYKATNLAKYGVENPFQSKEIKNKIKATNLEKYGVENIMLSSIGKSKVKNAILEKYGVENIMYLKETKVKIKNTNLEKYGVEYPIQNIIFKDKVKATNMCRYGVENVQQVELIKDKTKTTNLEKYGVENVFQSEHIKDKIKSTNLERYGVDSNKQIHIKSLVPLINSPEFWLKFVNQGDILNYFTGLVSNATIYNWIRKYRPDLELKSAISYPHMILNNFLEELNIKFEINTRRIIAPKELDIFIPSHNLAIEVNGNYWHSDTKGKDKTYHLNKLNRCNDLGINLLQFSDINIINKTNLVCSIIKSNLDLNERILAKETTIHDIDDKTAEIFYNNNHLHGYKSAEVHRGLFYNDELVTLISLGKYSDKDYDYEVIRYANLINYNVINGFSKLIDNSCCNGKLVSYIDRNISNGKLYEESGWSLETILPPNYQHIKNDKIWDCGIKVYSYKL